jgi:RNA polymerase sigma factor (sigma-70 family)
MANASPGALLRHLRHVVAPSSDSRDDHELLADFAARRDHTAFAVLVRRHGGLVLNVCRRVLHHEQDAEDAFQATFLVLAAKAGSVPTNTAVAAYLHGIAYRLALKVRREAVRRRRREARAQTSATADVAAELSWREVQTVLEEEIQRLPEKYRTPFVLCCLEGVSRAEAGRQMGVKEGTVWSRLSEARGRLQERLTRRGIALAAVLGAMAVSEKTVRAELREAVVQAATGSLPDATSARAATLAQAGVQTMASRWKLALIGVAALLTVGVGSVVCQALTARAPEPPEANPQPKAVAEAKKAEAPSVRLDRHGDPLPSGAIARLGTVRWRHGFFVQALAYSPDGKMIAAVGAGRAITLWDAATGKEIHQFPNRGQPQHLAFSPDGKMLATTSTPECHLWDVATGKELKTLKGHQNGLSGVAFSPDSKTVATVSYDGTLRLWDAATGTEKRRIECGQGDLYATAFSPDGKVLVSAGKDGTIRFRDPNTGEERRQLTGHKKEILSVVFSPDGKHLASASADETIRLWDPATGRKVHVLGEKLGEYRLPIAFSPDSRLLASGHRDGTIRLWDVASGTERRLWQVAALTVRAVAFSPDGQTLASGGVWESGIRLWDVATGREKHPGEEHRGLVDLVRFSPDGKTLLSIGRDRRVLQWDLATQKPHCRFTWPAKGFSTIALSPDGDTLAACGWPDFEVRLWDLRTGKPGRVLGKHEKRNGPLTFSPDGRLLASGGEDQVIHVWDVRDGKEIRQIKGFTAIPSSLRFALDGKALAGGFSLRGGNGTGEPTLRLWDLDDGNERCSFDCHTSTEGALAFSPDGTTLASSSLSQSGWMVRLWDARTGKELCHHDGHGEEVGALAFSPDGKLVASGSGNIGTKDNSVHVWEAATGRLIRRFEGHHSCVSSVAFSPDGLTLASGAGDSTILLWDITGRRPDGQWHVKARTPQELDSCWTAVASEDTAKAYDAVWSLVASPEQSVPFLRQRLRPVPRADSAVVARLLADLDSDDFTVRQRATDELSKFGDAITADLRRALAKRPPLEVRRRIQQQLDQTHDWTPERLLDHRAIQVLERIGTPAARQVLETLADGAPDARRTEEAKAALRHVKPR